MRSNAPTTQEFIVRTPDGLKDAAQNIGDLLDKSYPNLPLRVTITIHPITDTGDTSPQPEGG